MKKLQCGPVKDVVDTSNVNMQMLKCGASPQNSISLLFKTNWPSSFFLSRTQNQKLLNRGEHLKSVNKIHKNGKILYRTSNLFCFNVCNFRFGPLFRTFSRRLWRLGMSSTKTYSCALDHRVSQYLRP